jgi:hypothetical protein
MCSHAALTTRGWKNAVRVDVSSRDNYQSFHSGLDFRHHMSRLEICTKDSAISNPDAPEAPWERRRRSHPVERRNARRPAAMSCEGRFNRRGTDASMFEPPESGQYLLGTK